MKRIVISCCFHRARKEEQLRLLVRAITNAVWRCSQKNMSLSTLCIAYQKVITVTRFHAKQFLITLTACQKASCTIVSEEDKRTTVRAWILCKVVLGFFWTTYLPYFLKKYPERPWKRLILTGLFSGGTYIRTFYIRRNCHSQKHLPTSMSLRYS